MADEYIITQEDLNQGKRYLQTLTTEHPVCRIADGVPTIGDGNFWGCDNLTSIIIPDSVTTIFDNAFKNCSSLTSVTLGNGILEIRSHTFEYCYMLENINIPLGVESIKEYVFDNCRQLTSINIPNSVTSIGEGAFQGSGLTSINLPNSISEISGYTFSGCSNLTSIIIPNGVTSIGECAFSDCSSLTNVEVPDSVNSVGEGIFDGCSNIQTVNVGPNFDQTLLEDSGIPSTAQIVVVEPEPEPDPEPEPTPSDTDPEYNQLDERLLVKGNERITRDLKVQGNIFGDQYHTAFLPNIKSTKVVTDELELADDLTVPGDLTVNGETSLKNTTVTGKLTNEGDTEIKGDLDVSGEIIARKDVSISGDLFVNGTQHINDSETSQTSDDYMVLRHNKTVALGVNEHSGIAVHNYMPNKTATLTTDNQGIWRVADNSETSTVYTNVSSFNGDYFSGITQATSVTVNEGIKTAFDEDEYDEVCWYATNDKYYHFDGIHFFELGLVDNALTIGAQITDASLITALEALTRYDLVYFRSLTVTGISEVQNQPLLTRAEESALDNGDILTWDATTKKAVNLTRPVLNNTYLKALIDSQTGVVTYTWASGGGNGVAFIGTRAQYNAARLIPQGQDGFIPAHSKVIITDEDAYVTGEER